MNNIDYTLYLVTNRFDMNIPQFLDVIQKAIDGGVTIIQLREKNISSLNFYKLALKVKELTSKNNIPLIINDRIDIAQAIDAEGVHLGQDDIPCNIARKILGENKIIGISADTLKDCKKAVSDGADYVGVGAIYPTNTKNNVNLVKKEELNSITENINIPIIAIGGINQENKKELYENYNVEGVAVVSAIMKANDPQQASLNFL